MTDEELGVLFPIRLVEPNDNWPQIFEEEKEKLLAVFNDLKDIRIEHIGSTAIAGIKAKDTIDILMEVPENIPGKTIIERICKEGYEYTQQLDNPPPHMMFVKGYTINGFRGQAFHIHVRYFGDWNEIYFRDYLRAHKEVAREYEAIKIELEGMHRNNRETYTEAKTKFVEEINDIAKKEKKE